MALAFAISMYVVIWWIVLFAMLPIGVRTQSEEGEVTPAPRKARRTSRAAAEDAGHHGGREHGVRRALR